LYSSLNFITVIKSRPMRWTEDVARVTEIRNAYNFLSKNLEDRDHLSDLGVDGSIT